MVDTMVPKTEAHHQYVNSCFHVFLDKLADIYFLRTIGVEGIEMLRCSRPEDGNLLCIKYSSLYIGFG